MFIYLFLKDGDVLCWFRNEYRKFRMAESKEDRVRKQIERGQERPSAAKPMG
jgi:hypothetical protein